MKSKSSHRWFVVTIFFFFVLLHQSDKLLIGPLTTQIMETFDITRTQMGAVVSGALLVGAILYPVWGYLYDRFARSKLLALASLIWGATTWLSAIAPTYSSFMVTRASTGIDDSSYPGIFSLLSDYFSPNIRGKIFGFLQLAQPLGYMVGLIMATMVSGLIGWRAVFYITGSLGLVLAVVIFFGVKDPSRGMSEPELEQFDQIAVFEFDLKKALGLFRKRSLILLFIQGFVGVFPWNVITYWFFNYLETERNYSSDQVLGTMAPAILVLAVSYFIGGALGDYFFKKTKRGRILVSMVGVLLGAFFLVLTIRVPVENQALFAVYLMITAVFIPIASPNVISSVYDISLPEVRSTAMAVQYFIENGGAALAPFLAGYIADMYNLETSILYICVIAWILGAIILGVTSIFIPKDIDYLRSQMRERAELQKSQMISP